MRAGFQRHARCRLRGQKLAQTLGVQLVFPFLHDFALPIHRTIPERAITEVDTDGPFWNFASGSDILLHGWSPFCTSSSASPASLPPLDGGQPAHRICVRWIAASQCLAPIRTGLL